MFFQKLAILSKCSCDSSHDSIGEYLWKEVFKRNGALSIFHHGVTTITVYRYTSVTFKPMFSFKLAILSKCSCDSSYNSIGEYL